MDHVPELISCLTAPQAQVDHGSYATFGPEHSGIDSSPKDKSYDLIETLNVRLQGKAQPQSLPSLGLLHWLQNPAR